MAAAGGGRGGFLRQMSGRNRHSGGSRAGWGFVGGWVSGGGYAGEGEVVVRKRVLVLVDDTSGSKHAMMWALTHATNAGDVLTLLHIAPPPPGEARRGRGRMSPQELAGSLGSMCKASKPEVEVEALVVQEPRSPEVVISLVKKLEVSVLVLSQGKPSLLSCLFQSGSESFVEECINSAECLALAVRKQSKGVSGYLISSRWQKNFWLLA